MTLLMSMMVITMRTDVILTIKNTLEDMKGITTLSLNTDDSEKVIFGIYVNDIRNSLSFLSLPEEHIETTIDGINIQFFELGAVLHNIYFNGALSFIDILYPNDEIMQPSEEYFNLCVEIAEHLPFHIAKFNYIQSIQNFRYEDDNEQVLILTEIMRSFVFSLKNNSEYDPGDYTYIKKIESEADFVSACNELNKFQQWLNGINNKKVSEKDLNRINDLYMDIQIMHMKV